MSFNIANRYLTGNINRHLEKAQEQFSDSLEKLSSGTVFSKQDPRPADRALADGLELKLRGLNSSKRNVNDGISLLQTAESGLEEVSNLLLRMKEINVSASNNTVGDQDRQYLFVEFAALRDEVDRVAETTTFNGIKLLNGTDSGVPEQLIFRMGDPQKSEFADNADKDINLVTFDGLKSVVATAAGLGIPDVKDMLSRYDGGDGMSVNDAIELMRPSDSDKFATVYDEALHQLTQQRSVFGGLQSRMQHALSYLDVYQENIAAAKSNISDTDYAHEISKLTESKILMSAATSMLSQGDFSAHLMERLLDRV